MIKNRKMKKGACPTQSWTWIGPGVETLKSYSYTMKYDNNNNNIFPPSSKWVTGVMILIRRTKL